MDQAIIIEENIGFVPIGRPVGRRRSNAKFCKECGIELDFGNARPTKKGSGSLRSTCRSCESAKSNARYKARTSTKPKKITKRISRGPVFVERPNLIGMAAQRVIYHEIEGSPRHIAYYQDTICDECGGIIRYDEHIDRVCEKCGLMGDQVIYSSLDMEYGGEKTKQHERSRYDLGYIINRDSEFGRQHDRAGKDPSYTKYYKKSLDVGKVPDYYEAIQKIKGRYRYG
jgi:hypothetical protein